MKTEIPVTVDPKEVEPFLEYLVLGIRASVAKRSSGEADELADGTYVETIRCGLKVAADEAAAVWTLTVNPDGSLGSICVSVEDGAPDGWREAAEAVVNEAQSLALKGKRTRIFYRQYFAYFGPPLDGEYYIDDFRIAPSSPSSGLPFGNGEEVILIDQYSEGIGGNNAAALGRLQAQDRTSLLSVFLDVGLHRIPIESRWVYDSFETCKLLQLGHRPSVPAPDEMPAEGVECSPGNSYDVNRGNLGEEEAKYPRNELRCPSDIHRLFEIYGRLPRKEKSAFSAAARLFQIASNVGRYYPSVEMSYYVAAVDALNLGEGGRQKMFVDLVSAYHPSVDGKALGALYGSVRSAHFHFGKFPRGEDEVVDLGRPMVLQRTRYQNFYEQRFVRALARNVLTRWLLDRAT